MGLASDLWMIMIMYPRLWVLSGAGISTESGIPDFRSPGTGLWEKVDPMEVFSVNALARHPERFFRLGMPLFRDTCAARPNIAHEVLGKLQMIGLVGPIVTQNIDGLHQKGGSFHTYEVHGHIRTATCMGCGQTVRPMDEVLADFENGMGAPLCPKCRAVLKPDVILFGDAMPADYLNARLLKSAYAHHETAVLVMGSSLTVSPVNAFPLEFDHLTIINNDRTPLDGQADHVWRTGCGSSLGELWSFIQRLCRTESIEPLPEGFLPGAVVSSLAGSVVDRKGRPRNLTADASSLLMSEVKEWQEVLSSVSGGVLQRAIAHDLRQELGNLEGKLEGRAAGASKAREALLIRMGSLVKDHFQAFEVWQRTKQDGEAVKRRLLATALGFLGWYQDLRSRWGSDVSDLSALRDAIVQKGHATSGEVKEMTSRH